MGDELLRRRVTGVGDVRFAQRAGRDVAALGAPGQQRMPGQSDLVVRADVRRRREAAAGQDVAPGAGHRPVGERSHGDPASRHTSTIETLACGMPSDRIRSIATSARRAPGQDRLHLVPHVAKRAADIGAGQHLADRG
jgi:hypothetical protein